MQKDKKLLSMNDLYRSRKIYWIDSIPTLKRWVLRDYEGKNLLGTIVMKNEGRGHRYYIPEENVEKFIKAFENNEFSEYKEDE